MIGLTLIFHIFSALCIVLLTYWILHLKRRVEFGKSVLNAGSGDANRVTLDWSRKFFRNFSDLIGASYANTGGKGAPIRIFSGPWLKFHLEFSIQSIRLENSNSLVLVTRKKPSNVKAQVKVLESSTSGKLKITIKSGTKEST